MVTSANVVYYLTLVSYPLKVIISGFMLCTITNYLGIHLKRGVYYLVGLLVVSDLFVSIFNDSHQLMMKVTSSVSSKMAVWTAEKGYGFYIHATVAYLLLLSGVIILYVVVRKTENKNLYAEISKTIFFSVLLVVVTSVVQLVFFIPYDITYIGMVILINNLYRVIYQNDMLFNLRTSGRVKILSNMREMYILTDKFENIVEVSHLLTEEFSIEEDEVLLMNLDGLVKRLENEVVFHESIRVGKELADIEKKHYHIKKKRFRLEGMESYGYMVLLYDESQVVELLRELNRLSNFDDMTGLHNRNFIESIMKTYNPSIYPNLGVLSLDLNGLKTNNDYIGHDRGDYLLKALAKVIINHAQKNSVAARIGEDEFILIVENTSLSDLKEISKLIHAECFSEDVSKRISVSIGCAIRDNGNSIYELIKEADKEMYIEKKKTSKKYSLELMEAINVSGFIR